MLTGEHRRPPLQLPPEMSPAVQRAEPSALVVQHGASRSVGTESSRSGRPASATSTAPGRNSRSGVLPSRIGSGVIRPNGSSQPRSRRAARCTCGWSASGWSAGTAASRMASANGPPRSAAKPPVAIGSSGQIGGEPCRRPLPPLGVAEQLAGAVQAHQCVQLPWPGAVPTTLAADQVHPVHRHPGSGEVAVDESGERTDVGDRVVLARFADRESGSDPSAAAAVVQPLRGAVGGERALRHWQTGRRRRDEPFLGPTVVDQRSGQQNPCRAGTVDPHRVQSTTYLLDHQPLVGAERFRLVQDADHHRDFRIRELRGVGPGTQPGHRVADTVRHRPSRPTHGGGERADATPVERHRHPVDRRAQRDIGNGPARIGQQGARPAREGRTDRGVPGPAEFRRVGGAVVRPAHARFDALVDGLSVEPMGFGRPDSGIALPGVPVLLHLAGEHLRVR